MVRRRWPVLALPAQVLVAVVGVELVTVLLLARDVAALVDGAIDVAAHDLLAAAILVAGIGSSKDHAGRSAIGCGILSKRLRQAGRVQYSRVHGSHVSRISGLPWRLVEPVTTIGRRPVMRNWDWV